MDELEKAEQMEKAEEEGLEQPDVSPAETEESEEPETPAQPEVEKLLARIQELEADNRGKSQAITRLSKTKSQLEAEMVAKIDYLNKKLDLLMRQQTGDFEPVSLEQQTAAIEAEYTQKRQALQVASEYQQHAEQSFGAIKEIMEAAGLDINSDAPEVSEVREAWNEALNRGERLDGVVAKAARIVKQKTPRVDKLKEQIRKEVLEEFKRSGKLKVETGAPSGQASDLRRIEKMYAEGDLTTQQYEEALRKLGKL